MGKAAVIPFSFAMAFMLTAIPVPDWAVSWLPAWVALVLIYWCLATPGYVGVLTGWVLGLLLDVMHGSILGQHALGLSVVAYVTLIYHQRVRIFPLVQQSILIALLLFIYLAIMLAIYNTLGSIDYGYNYLFGALSSALLWPWLFVILRDLRRRAALV
ncbi:MAG: rod shape-determining protein MreD [Pseudomonadota bacterium]